MGFSTNEVTLVAGSTGGHNDASGAAAQFQLPMGIAITPDGTTLIVGDRFNNGAAPTNSAGGMVRAIDIATKAVTTVETNDVDPFVTFVSTVAVTEDAIVISG